MSDVTRKRGDTRPERFVFTDQSTGLPLSLDGCTLLLTVDPSKEPADSSKNIMQLSGVIVDAVNGVVEFSPTALQADHVGKFFFDVQLTDAQGAISTLDDGKFVLKQDITK